MFLLLTSALLGYIVYSKYLVREDETNRAAETVIPPQEEKTLTSIKPTAGKPAQNDSSIMVSSTFNPVQSSYQPFSEVNRDEAESRLKLLNIQNRFLYG